MGPRASTLVWIVARGCYFLFCRKISLYRSHCPNSHFDSVVLTMKGCFRMITKGPVHSCG